MGAEQIHYPPGLACGLWKGQFFSFPGLIHFIPNTSSAPGDLVFRLPFALQVPGPAWRQRQPWRGEGRGRSMERGRRGRNRSFWQEGASWDLLSSPPGPGRRAVPPARHVSLPISPTPSPGLHSPGVSLLSGVGLKTG